jgi:hypothetical protein
MNLKRNQFIGGIICFAAAVVIFLVGTTSESIPPAIILTIVGVGLVATARR